MDVKNAVVLIFVSAPYFFMHMFFSKILLNEHVKFIHMFFSIILYAHVSASYFFMHMILFSALYFFMHILNMSVLIRQTIRLVQQIL